MCTRISTYLYRRENELKLTLNTCTLELLLKVADTPNTAGLRSVSFIVLSRNRRRRVRHRLPTVCTVE